MSDKVIIDVIKVAWQICPLAVVFVGYLYLVALVGMVYLVLYIA